MSAVPVRPADLDAAPAERSRRARTGRRRFRPGALPVALIVVLLVLPSLIVVPMSVSPGEILRFPPDGFSLDWYRTLFTEPQWTSAMLNSLQVALATTVLAVLIGAPAGLALGIREWRGRGLLLGLVLTPVVAPPVVVAIGMYTTYAQVELIGRWGLIAAHTVLAVPFVVVTVMSAARQIDPTWLDAARSLGASPLRVALTVLVPLAGKGIASGALFAFITSWDEVVVSLYLTDPGFKTLPVQMWNQLRERVDPTVAAVASVMLLITTSAMVAALVIGWRRDGAARENG
jgi:putative spermidine/putrescine transport system permease protein